MKYIEIAILVLGVTFGAIVGSMIKIGNGSAALIGALLVTALGFLLLFLFKRGHQTKWLKVQGRKQQNELERQQSPAINDIRHDVRRHADKWLDSH